MLRGVSELVSAALLSLIVLIVGGYIVVNIIEIFEEQKSSIEKRFLDEAMRARSIIGIVASYYDDNSQNVVVVVASGDYPVKIYSVYLNNSIASNCTIKLTNGEESQLEDFSLKPYSLATIACKAPPGLYTVKISYEGGEATALAK